MIQEPDLNLLAESSGNTDKVIEEYEEDLEPIQLIPDIEDEEYWNDIKKENKRLKNAMWQLIDGPKTTDLAKLEAARIISSINHNYVSEGLLHRVRRTIPTVIESEKKFYEAYEELFKNTDRRRLLTRRSYLKKRIEQAKKKRILVHPDIVRAWQEEWKKINNHLKRKIKVKVPEDKAILDATETSTANVQKILAGWRENNEDTEDTIEE